jgi:integrase/recombinase XerD
MVRPDRPLFPSASGRPLTRPAVTARLHLAVQRGRGPVPVTDEPPGLSSLCETFDRMHMLQAGVDITVIALWLGHENSTTTHKYVEAESGDEGARATSRAAPRIKQTRYRPTNRLLAFLQGL